MQAAAFKGKKQRAPDHKEGSVPQGGEGRRQEGEVGMGEVRGWKLGHRAPSPTPKGTCVRVPPKQSHTPSPPNQEADIVSPFLLLSPEICYLQGFG